MVSVIFCLPLNRAGTYKKHTSAFMKLNWSLRENSQSYACREEEWWKDSFRPLMLQCEGDCLWRNTLHSFSYLHELEGKDTHTHTRKPMAISFQCMTKPTTIKKNNNNNKKKKKKKVRTFLNRQTRLKYGMSSGMNMK